MIDETNDPAFLPDDSDDILEFPLDDYEPPLVAFDDGSAAREARRKEMCSRLRDQGRSMMATSTAAHKMMVESLDAAMDAVRKAKNVLYNIGASDPDQAIPGVEQVAREFQKFAVEQEAEFLAWGHFLCFTGNSVEAPRALAVEIARIFVVFRCCNWASGRI